MNYSKWKISERSAEIPAALLAEGYPPLLAAMLNIRGIATAEEARRFLYGGAESLIDPMRMKDMDKAVRRIKAAFAAGETVAVYGDYDVDGITATCLLTDWLRSCGMDCCPYIPDRIEEGYGLNSAAIDSLKNKGVSLIISVDCGITAVDEAKHAREVGVDLIITDHHECREQALPEAVAVINPKQDGCDYPNKDLAGVGVALKLICAVEGNDAEVVRQYADLAAIGTVADVVPLTGENRYIVRTGLGMIEQTSRPGIAALLKESGAADKKISSSTIGFTLAPRLNAAGRLGCVSVAGRLLMTDDETEANRLAAQLCELNRRRQLLETEIWDEASGMMDGKSPDTPIVLASEKWHQGVIGIAASKLAEQYSLPTVMICLDGEKGKGSCRSYGGFNLFEALSACSDYLEGFGGHALAAGLNIKRDKLREFCRAFGEYYRQNKPEELPTLNCDIEIIDPKMLSMDGVAALSLLEPFGSGNPKPIMCISGARLDRVTPIGGGRHLRLNISFKGCGFECVFFSHTQAELGLSAGERIDIAFTPQINEFRFRSSVQLQLTAVRRHDPRPLCERILKELPLMEAAQYCPDRSAFVKAWRRLQSAGGAVASDIDGVISQCPHGLEPERFCICLLALSELGLLHAAVPGSVLGARIVSGTRKVNLEDSKLIKRLKARRS
ncbi:MAG: single-stranded-DNA-specific exonuclease RecJ [Oscillospiraceae bacterium]|nr:single-stranded-DNA-specific exonuclease RecJ [Oscillospiraceae bacterium]